MTRHLINLVAVGSLLMCGAAIALWVGSYGHVHRYSAGIGPGEWSLAVARGKLFCYHSPDAGRRFQPGFQSLPVGYHRFPGGQPARVGVRNDRDLLPGSNDQVRPVGLGVYTVRGQCSPCVVETIDCSVDPPRPITVTTRTPVPPASQARYRRHHGLIFPIPFAATAFAMLPATAGVAAMRRRRRFGRGLCARCGYDLRATPQRCPECGATP